MSTLLTNIRRASAPLQEHTQQIGIRARQLLLSAGSAMSSADLGAVDSQALLVQGPEGVSSSLNTSGPGASPRLSLGSSHGTGNSATGKPPLAPSPASKAPISSSEEGAETRTELASSSASTEALHDTDNNTVAVSMFPTPSPSRHGSETGALMKSVPASPSSSASVSPSSGQRHQTPQGPPPTVAEVPSQEQPVPWRGIGSEEESEKVVVCQSRALPHLFTRIRDRNTPSHRFKFFAQRIALILAEEGIACLESSRPFITTPTGATFSSVFVDESRVCVVSILRAGDVIAEAAQNCLPHAPVGKLLIQRNEDSEDRHPVFFYSKLPPSVAEMQVLLCDPMLATGGSANMAIQALVDSGVKQSAIVFVTVVVCPEGLSAVRGRFPEVTIVTGAVDDCLDERRYIVPGLGDFGDRFFGTVS